MRKFVKTTIVVQQNPNCDGKTIDFKHG